MEEPRYLTAEETTAQLGISLSTLYSYVSRGLIQSEAGVGDSRRRRYNGDDVRKLKERKEQRHDPSGAAKAALHWGAPILDSALTLITDDGLYYRGHDASGLAGTHTFEQVASLLWTGSFSRAHEIFQAGASGLHSLNSLIPQEADLEPLQRWIIALITASTKDPAAYTLLPQRGAEVGARIVRLMVACVAAGNDFDSHVSEVLARRWAEGQPVAAGLLNAALVLSADHELNLSSFVARAVASGGASLYSVVIAGLAAMQGFRHGGDIMRVEAMLEEIGEPENTPTILLQRIRSGERVPGFGHRLYPAEDPRGRRLLELVEQASPHAPALRLASAVSASAERMIGQGPTIDFALAVMARVLCLPPGSALAIFSLGRTAGWIAHALEQYARGDLIRPRAAYTGVPPIVTAP
ncbi:MAG: citrate synthase family protein [Chloroflexota bacterium]|nr:citrate synthase family protein [Chloroflexota bacterium]